MIRVWIPVSRRFAEIDMRMALEQERCHVAENVPDPERTHRRVQLEAHTHPIRSDDPYGYLQYLRDRWDAGESFINLEHDVLPWPGALTDLWSCPELWCAFPIVYSRKLNHTNLACVKFEEEFIAWHPGLWDGYPPDWDWRSLDAWLYKRVAPRAHHRHGPPVLHQNPVAVGLYGDGEP